MEQREEIALAVDGRYIACCKLCSPPSENELYKCAGWDIIKNKNCTRSSRKQFAYWDTPM